MPAESAVRAAFGCRRVTGARRAIVEATCEMSGAFTVDDLAEATRRIDPGSGSIATAYRAVAAMEETGFLERVGTRGGQAMYVRCGAHDHHHHVVCEGCGRTAEAVCPIDVAAVADSGFLVTRHEVTLYGLCPACAIEGTR